MKTGKDFAPGQNQKKPGDANTSIRARSSARIAEDERPKPRAAAIVPFRAARPALPAPNLRGTMPTKKPDFRSPEDEYPPVGPGGFADAMRKRREEDERNADLAREIANSRKADVFGVRELMKRLEVYGRGPRGRD
jgi:hypothetical protein